jgi:hypothetical protein
MALAQRLFGSDWVGTAETLKHVIRRFLQAGSGFMELPGGLGGKLGKLISIGHVCHRTKNQVRSHKHLGGN